MVFMTMLSDVHIICGGTYHVAQQSWNYGFPDITGHGFASNGPLVNKESIYDIRFSINDEKSKNVLAKAFIRVLVSDPSKCNLDGSGGKRQCCLDLASDCNAVNIVQFNMLFFTRKQTNESLAFIAGIKD